MEVLTFATKAEMAQAAASQATRILREAIARNGQARVIAATGASQFEFLEALMASSHIACGCSRCAASLNRAAATTSSRRMRLAER